MPDEEPISEEDEYLRKLGVSIGRVRRKLAKVSQSELGQRIGRDKDTISRWENGRTSLSAYNLSQLWEALAIPAEWLLDPVESVTELDRRIARLRRVAAVAAQAASAEVQARRAVGGAGAPRGRRSA